MSVTPRDRLLFATPVMPAATGNGLAMRAGLFLDALSRMFDVDVVVVPVVEQPDDRDDRRFVNARAASVVVRTLEPDSIGTAVARLADPLERERMFELDPLPTLASRVTKGLVANVAASFAEGTAAVHVLRSYLAPVALPFLADPEIVCLLDLDDDEVGTRRHLSQMHDRREEHGAAKDEAIEAGAYARLEDYYAPRFDGVVASSAPEAERAGTRLGMDVDVIPNAVPVPEARSFQPSGLFDLLFVGNLSYAPNEDAASWLCETIAPRVSRLLGRAVRVAIVGAAPTRRVRALASAPEVAVAADVEDLSGWYSSSRVAVVPVRAGGGMRIKALEAFAHGCPVVSTATGLDGIAAVPGEHALVADDAEGFARRCADILTDPQIAGRLADLAYRFVSEHYSLDVVGHKIQEYVSRRVRECR